MIGGHFLANRCYMCCCNGESMDHLLLHCLVSHSLWCIFFKFLEFGSRMFDVDCLDRTESLLV